MYFSESNKPKRILRPWSEEEKSILEESFDDYLRKDSQNKQLPGFQQIREVKNKNECLSSRTEAQIKIMISNMKKKKAIKRSYTHVSKKADNVKRKKQRFESDD